MAVEEGIKREALLTAQVSREEVFDERSGRRRTP